MAIQSNIENPKFDNGLLRRSAPRNDGFTLAEVLITLVIIGVIAAITVPTLITKYQKEQTVTRLKKAYSSLAQTTAKAIVDNGPMNTWKYASNDDLDSKKFVQIYILPYMNVMENCLNANGNIKTSNNCTFKYFRLNSDLTENVLGDSIPRFILTDGTLIGISCDYTESNGSICQIHVDINGAKKPNRLGKDVFRFAYWLTPGTANYSKEYYGKVVPLSIQYLRSSLISATLDGACNKNVVNSAGTFCAALIMKDGWRIADDYPW